MPKRPHFPFATSYGHFSEDGTSYVITRPDTPRPWVNVICAGTYGVVISQGGSGTRGSTTPRSTASRVGART